MRSEEGAFRIACTARRLQGAWSACHEVRFRIEPVRDENRDMATNGESRADVGEEQGGEASAIAAAVTR
jgi:hypothetical protein